MLRRSRSACAAVSFADSARGRGDRVLAQILRHHDQVAIGILQEELALAGLLVSGPAPDLSELMVDRPAAGGYRSQDRLYALEIELKHRPSAEWALQRTRFPPAVPLAEHDLMAFGMLEIGELLLGSPVGDLEPEHAPPEFETGLDVAHEKLGHDFRPTRLRRTATLLQIYPPMSCSHSCSVSAVTPKSLALPALEPASSPITT